MKKVAKNCIIGVIVYGACQLFFDLGEGHMLGALAKLNDEYECTPDEAIYILNNNDGNKHKLRTKIIALEAKIVKEQK